METLGPIGLAVMRHALDGVADLMSLTLVRTARSSIVRNGWDFSSAVLTSEGELVGQGLSQPMHLAGMMPALRACMDRYKNNIHPEDVMVNNDPYEGGSHLPDVFLFKPVFVGDTLLAYLSAMIHHLDMGLRRPSSQAADSTEIYQEGLRNPPLKLYQRWEPNETLLRIIEKAVRTPEVVLADFQSQIAALRAGEREILRLVQQYGVEEFRIGLQELLDYTERLTRQGLRTLPDGTWTFTDSLDNYGITDDTIYARCTLTKRGDEVFVDFDGTSPQSRGAIQGPFATNKGMVYIVLKFLLGLDIPNTSGLLRPVTTTAPEGSFANPQLPAPVAARYIGCRLINHATWGAFAQAVPERVFGCPGGSLCYLIFSGSTRVLSPGRHGSLRTTASALRSPWVVDTTRTASMLNASMSASLPISP